MIYTINDLLVVGNENDLLAHMDSEVEFVNFIMKMIFIKKSEFHCRNTMPLELFHFLNQYTIYNFKKPYTLLMELHPVETSIVCIPFINCLLKIHHLYDIDRIFSDANPKLFGLQLAYKLLPLCKMIVYYYGTKDFMSIDDYIRLHFGTLQTFESKFNLVRI